MAEYLTVNNAAKATTLLLATTGVTVGIRSLLSPLAAAEAFGLPQGQSRPNPFIQICGGRNLASGLAILACAYQGNWKAVGTMVSFGAITAATDAVVTSNEGNKDAAIGHGVAGLMSGGLGLWFLYGQ